MMSRLLAHYDEHYSGPISEEDRKIVKWLVHALHHAYPYDKPRSRKRDADYDEALKGAFFGPVWILDRYTGWPGLADLGYENPLIKLDAMPRPKRTPVVLDRHLHGDS
jgi:hypothetical protein